MHVAVVGCGHGRLDDIYSSIKQIEKSESVKVDLLLICGDFQAIRNKEELRTMACPEKYRNMESYYKYYNGEKKAPVMTIVIGGNHESSLHFYELYHGGWLADNIYFLGYAGVVNFNGLRICGLSGIFKKHDYSKGFYESPPFLEKSDQHSVYHSREFNVEQLCQLRSKVHIVMTHDWPTGIAFHGDVENLIRR
ncbi:lariat debranching enzyme, partial [Bonamia ostreae]